MAELQLMVSASRSFISISSSSPKACCHSEALPQALMAELQVTLSAPSPTSASRAKAACQAKVSQTLTVALKLMTLGVTEDPLASPG